jgi:hypothetical protein
MSLLLAANKSPRSYDHSPLLRLTVHHHLGTRLVQLHEQLRNFNSQTASFSVVSFSGNSLSHS